MSTTEDMQQKNKREQDYLDAQKMTVESVRTDIEAFGCKPSADDARNLLDKIMLVEDLDRRLNLTTEAALNFKGPLKDMAKQYSSRVNKAIKERNEASAKRGGEPFVKAESKLPAPFWASPQYGKYQGRTYAYSRSENGTPGVPMHSPLRLLGSVRYVDRTIQGLELTRGVLVEFENEEGETRTLTFTAAEALEGKSLPMLSDLKGAGVGLQPDGIKAICNGILAGAALPDAGDVCDYPGWRGDDFYLTPGGDGIGDPSKGRRIRVAKPISGISKENAIGNLEGWCAGIAPAFNDEMIAKVPHVAATILFGLVSPLIDRAKEEMSFILGLAKRTTGLKTFAMRAMASVWGDITEAKGVLMTLSATENKIEEYAIQRSGCAMGLDESTLADPAKLPMIVYRLSTGTSRGRKGEDPLHWHIAAVVSSEVGLAQLMRMVGIEPPPGLWSRIVEIAGTGERVSDEPVGTMRAVADPKHVKHYGHAGPAFIRQMISGGYDRERIANEISARVAKLIGGRGEREQERRASRAIAYIGLAGSIAKDAGLIPADFDVDAFCAAIWEQCRSATDTTTPVVNRVIGTLAAGLRDGSIAIHDNKRGLALGTAGDMVCIQAFGRNADPVFSMTEAALARIIGGREAVQDATKILDDAGLLQREQKDRLYWRGDRAGLGKGHAYVIHAAAVLGEGAEAIIEEYRAARMRQEPDTTASWQGNAADAIKAHKLN